MIHCLISLTDIESVIQKTNDRYDTEGAYALAGMADRLISESVIFEWLPIDPANPIPDPTNDRQVLQLYKPIYDNEESIRDDKKPIITFKPELYLGQHNDRPLNTLFYWENFN